ncbi:MAG: hypothetical protein NC211_03600 [Alistipes senegalensis]|nr:hypothetical protein [Oxalobacter formigenes]MCM1280903.1 hypothetical protein [Alistipes senegalensis]
MASLSDLAKGFAENERPAGIVIGDDAVLAQIIAAARFYAGYAVLCSHESMDPGDVDEKTDITTSEWAIIRPLFLLYVERENAIHLEASRNMGVDPFGRSSSEISGEIAQMEAELPHKAFYEPIVTV